jgi:hypothetical protein
MLLLAGTLPIKGLKLQEGKGKLVNGRLMIGDRTFSLNRGTAAMMAACCAVCKKCDLEKPYCVVSGDIGRGEGSIPLYHYLRDQIPKMGVNVATFHYIMPNLPYHNEVLESIKTMKEKPFLIADAGYMYVAKMAGFAQFYDIFTPDLGELAFLADKEAPHPFYTRGFIFHMEDRINELIKLAYEGENAARFLFVKGKRDYICKDGEILKEIGEMKIPELEAIGGTGDTITGMVAGLIYQGISTEEALVKSARANRLAGILAKPTPATQIREIIEKIPQAMDEI